MLVVGGRTIDANNFVRAGALFGMGQLGKSVPEVQPFLWNVIYSPARKIFDRCSAFDALQTIGFGVEDIPTLAKLISNSVCDRNILAELAPEAVSNLIESNSLAAKPYLSSVEDLLDNPNPDTQFRAALALVKSEGADNPKIFSALHALFQRPNNRLGDYYKILAAQILGKAGPKAKPLVPDLLQFSKFASEIGMQEAAYNTIAKIEPGLGAQNADVAAALKEQQDDKRWSEKWKSGFYTLDDLRAALKEQHQALTAANHLAAMGAAAKAAVPDMIQAIQGKDEDARNEILADIHKIDPQVAVTKVEVNQIPLDVAFGNALSVLEKKPATQQNSLLKDSLLQVSFFTRWILPEELTAFTNNLSLQDKDAYQAFVKGLAAKNYCPAPSSLMHTN